jgi:glycerol-3-phosphate dehydrogenase (NAD(P)+)
MLSHVAVVGAGAWGTALALALAERGPVRLYTWEREHARALAEARENRTFLPGFPLVPEVEPTADLEFALTGAELVVFALPSQALRSVLGSARGVLPDVPLVIASKGIESGTWMLLTEVVADVLGAAAARRALVLSGPSFALEVSRSRSRGAYPRTSSSRRSITRSASSCKIGWRPNGCASTRAAIPSASRSAAR